MIIGYTVCGDCERRLAIGCQEPFQAVSLCYDCEEARRTPQTPREWEAARWALRKVFRPIGAAYKYKEAQQALGEVREEMAQLLQAWEKEHPSEPES